MDILASLGSTNTRVFLVPFVCAFLSVGLLRIILRNWSGTALAPIAIGSGFLISYALVTVFPLWPPAGGLGILPYAVASGILLGAALDLANAREDIRSLACLATSILLVMWVVREWGSGNITMDGFVLYGGLIFSGYWAMQRLDAMRDDGLSAPLSIATAAALLGILASMYGTSSSLFAIALASAAMGYAVWNWPKTRFPWGLTGTLTGGGVYLVLISELAFKNPAMALPLATSLLCFAIPSLSAWAFPVQGPYRPFVQISLSIAPIALGIYLMP